MVSGLNNELDSTNSTLNDVIDTWQTSINLTNESLDAISGITQTLSSFNSVIDLTEGWNMIGYGCPESIDVSEGLALYTDLVLICKDNNGSVYLPEFGFNGIVDFTPGYGYQLKISESIEGFSLCGEFTNVDNPQITDIETDNAQMQNDIHCLTGNPEIGDYCYGGIVFYVEEGNEGKYGLLASTSDIILAETSPSSYLDGDFPWRNAVEGMDSLNTINYMGYNDWVLPSLNHLELMYNTIGQGNNNIANFVDATYWSADIYNENLGNPLQGPCSNSSESQNVISVVNFNYGSSYGICETFQDPARLIRPFGDLTMGCMDSLACNYNPEANMADGSCEYPEQGYDCDGNVSQFQNFSFIGSYEGNNYYLSQGMSVWEDANLLCNNNGGHLVTISNEGENTFVTNTLIDDQSENLSYENWELRCFIGLKKTDETWSWVNDETTTYSSWAPSTNEPSGDGNCTITNHDIYHPNYGENYFGYWNDQACDSGEARFIMEIEIEN